MNTDIRYIFLDLGGTFRVIDEDPAYLAAARGENRRAVRREDGRSYPVVRGCDRQSGMMHTGNGR